MMQNYRLLKIVYAIRYKQQHNFTSSIKAKKRNNGAPNSQVGWLQKPNGKSIGVYWLLE